MEEKTALVFTGDIGFDRYMDKQWEDEQLLSDEILAFFESADHVIANVEGPLLKAERNTSTTGAQQLLHTMDPDATKLLKKINADIWCICNNHIMDAGADGVKSTLDTAESFGAQTVGAGMNLAEASKPVILPEAGGIGIFATGYQRACRAAGEDKAGCLSWSNWELIQKNIDEIKSKCRWCVIVCHGGEEFTSLPSPYVRDKYLKYLEMGADIVVCHHPHVPMNYETVGDKAIFYSLGNFIFDTDYQRIQYNTDIGVLLKISFTESDFSFEPMGLKILRGEEHIVKGELPRIFRDVQKEEYEKLIPLSEKAFIQATKRQQAFLNPDTLGNATEEQWEEHFTNPMRTGRVPGEALDFFIIRPIAEKEKEKAWQTSKLEDVKQYITDQIE